MVTLWHGYVSRITGLHYWILVWGISGFLSPKANNMEVWCFLCRKGEQAVTCNRIVGDSPWHPHDVTLMDVCVYNTFQNYACGQDICSFRFWSKIKTFFNQFYMIIAYIVISTSITYMSWQKSSSLVVNLIARSLLTPNLVSLWPRDIFQIASYLMMIQSTCYHKCPFWSYFNWSLPCHKQCNSFGNVKQCIILPKPKPFSRHMELWEWLVKY